MSIAYDQQLRRLAKETAIELGYKDFLREGVYAQVAGPNYETPSECRLLRICGADAVGMSTAPEVVVARHAGIRVLGKIYGLACMYVHVHRVYNTYTLYMYMHLHVNYVVVPMLKCVLVL